MLNYLASFQLIGVSIKDYNINYNRDAVPKNETDATMSFSLQLEIKDNKEKNYSMLSMGCDIYSVHESETPLPPLSISIEVIYKFNIIEETIFFKPTDEDRAKTLAHFIYLHFRNVLMDAFIKAGLSSIQVPYALDLLIAKTSN